MTVNLFTQNKWLRRLAWGLGGLFVLWGLAWLVVPPILKNQMERLATEQLGRKVTLARVDFKPWSLELGLHDLAVARSAGSRDLTPQFSIKRIYLDAELQSVFRLAPVLDAVTLEAPHMSLTYLGNGQYDITDILTRLSKPGAQPANQSQGFALYNLILSSGSLDFDDKTLGSKHQLRDLQLSLPFLSNLESKRVVVVEPHLAFKLNGSRFDSSAQTMPFAQTQKTDASIVLKKLDLMPYMAYLPPGLPVKFQSAVLSADIKLAFEQAPKAAVKISGVLQLDKVKLSGLKPQDAELLDFDSLKLTLDDIRPLEKVARLGAVELSAARLNVHRNRAGQLNLLTLDTPKDSASGKSDKRADHADQQPVKQASDAGWKFGIGKLLLGASTVAFRDDSTQPVARLALRDLTLEATGLNWPWVQPVPLTGSAMLVAEGASTAGKPQNPAVTANLSFKGEAGQHTSQIGVTASDLPLSLAAPYLAQFMAPELAGKLNAEIDVNWHGKGATLQAGQGEGLQLLARQLSLDDLSLTQGKTSLTSIKKLQLERAQVDLDGQKATVGKLTLSQPKLALSRGSDGRWMYQTWLKPTVQTTPSPLPQLIAPAAAEPLSKRPAESKPWIFAIDDLTLQGGALAFLDTYTPQPVAFDVSGLSLQLKNFSTAGGKSFSTHVSAHVRAQDDEPGQFDWRGSTAMDPLVVQGKLSAEKVPLYPFQAYLADVLNIDLVRAQAGFKGQVGYAQLAGGAQLNISGDAELQDFLANAGAAPLDARLPDTASKAALVTVPEVVAAGEELLRWKSLSLRGLNIALAPSQASQISVGETVLSDFFARLILSPAGRLNLQDVVKSPATAPSNDKQTQAGPAPVISFGPISLTRGQVHFSDRFIQPNYSANLTELTGSLGAFSSQTQATATKLAEVSLRGRAQSTASLEISGQINPLLSPPVLDIKGRVRDLELPPLSMYSVHYAGYGIERGKLSVDVSYQVQADGQLVANNKLVLNQLSFGNKVEGAPGNLPVKLAVALLADSNGVIDIELPVSGSLNDPQFRLGPIVFKLIVNLIGKAITSPFTLLAGALGGGSDELSQVTFTPGSAALTEQARAGLSKVAKALTQRPALRMTVVGTASLENEREAYQRERLKALVRAQKGSSPETAAVSEAEYPALLKAVYKKADFVKPRNLLGLVKDIPVEEMQALLLANLPAGEDAMRELALQRGLAVRDYLATQNLTTDRLFLGQPKTVSSEEKWSPRAQLSLGLP